MVGRFLGGGGGGGGGVVAWVNWLAGLLVVEWMVDELVGGGDCLVVWSVGGLLG